jgi:type I restriction-modification system DNA methylase subunit
MPVPQTVLTLIENFERNIDAYRNGQYNETQVRRDFIDPFFKALGWDMDNSLGYAEAYRDVIHEDTIKVGISTRAPDYSFRIGGARKFFLEAKKPSVNVKDDVEPAFQLRRYAWSAKLPLSIVTDFEEFAVYDCRQKPDKNDKASKSRLFYCTFRDYAEKWDEIAAIFSKDAVLKGSFDKYASTSKGKRGTTEVDSAFLEEIENWRNLLAHNIALRNDNLSQRELNFAVQQTIDRIIFLRICEDRGIEPYGKLMALQNGVNVYARLREMFHDADDRYNSGLFHFKREKGRAEAPDELTLKLEIDDKPLKEIFKNLYYPDCPYEFSVLGADILGSVYEQFLGKVIRLTSGNRAVVEDKPEVKKAGGVFYTPAYIVKYIVEHTVGKLLEGRNAKQAEGIRILDPACGSGSFLIGAYQHLLDWYLALYQEDTEKHSKGKAARIRPSAHGAWRLTTAEKKRILLEHIYGVDIDAQAVEVTKLSLLLKMLEGESDESLVSQGKLFHERVLPDLERNIQCGNSLIGPDFYDGQLDLDDEAAQRINVFDWQAAFPQVFKIPPNPPLSKGGNPQPPLQKGVERSGGGFDVVIGNPPYGATFGSVEAAYFQDNYAVWRGVKDVYALFIESALKTVHVNGLTSFIVPSAWLGGPDYRVLRSLLLNYQIDQIVSLPFDVFADAYVDTAIFVASSNKPIKNHLVKTFSFSKKEKITAIKLTENNYHKITQQLWVDDRDNKFILDLGALALVTSIRANSTSLFSDAISMKRGVLFDKELLTTKKISQLSHPYFEGDVYRYRLNYEAPQWIEFGAQMRESPKDFYWFEGSRLLLRRLVNRQQRLMATLATETFITNKNLYSIIPTGDYPTKFVLGLLNSRLISYLYIQQVSQATKDDFPQVTIKDILSIPFPSRPIQRSSQDKLISLVEKMLTLHQQLATAKTPQDTTLLQRQIVATDRQIDQLVYALYGLSDEEIALVEGEG